MPESNKKFDLNVEVFAVGIWNDIKVSLEMLHDMTANFNKLNSILDVPLKFGHNKEQSITDGEPALGWVDRVWVEGETLFAHFTDIPEIVYEAIKAKRYKNVSIEALFDVTHKGQKYGTVLTAVALLGADQPAVNTLSDLQTYMTSKNLDFTSHATFSKKPIEKEVHSPMTPEEKAEMDRMVVENTALKKTNETQAGSIAKFTTETNELKANAKAIEKSGKEAEFTATKKTMTEDLESLVKAGTITPAKRDELVGGLTVETVEQMKFTIDALKSVDTKKKPGGKDTSTSKGGNEDDSDLTAAERVSMKANEIIAKNSDINFSAAVQSVFKIDPKLAEEYARENDGGDE